MKQQAMESGHHRQTDGAQRTVRDLQEFELCELTQHLAKHLLAKWFAARCSQAVDAENTKCRVQ